MEFTPTQKQTAAWLAIAALIALALWLLAPVLTPFVVAGVLAYALNPLVDRLHAAVRRRVPRFVAVVVVELLFLVLLAGLMLLMVPILAKELPHMRAQLPALFDRLDGSLSPWLAQFGVNVALDIASIKAFVVDYLNTNYDSVFASVMSSLKLGGSVALAIVGNAVLIPVALFYLLLDWDHFVARALALVPPRARGGVDSFRREADAVLGQYLRGQLLVMIVMAVFYSVGLSLAGVELALPIGVFTGLAMFVPYLGFGIGLVLAAVACLLQFAPLQALTVVAAVYGSGQVLESLFLTPRMVGERIGLHPITVIFALLAFGQLFGFIGVLVALPASAVLLVAGRRLRASYVSSRLYTGQRPGRRAP